MIRSEWIKLWSVRSTYWTLAIGMSLMAAIAGIFAGTADPKHTINPTNALQGGVLAQLAFGVLGVLSIASEYSTGMIRTTFTAVPARPKALLAQAGVLFAVLAVCGQAIAALSFFIARLVFSSRGVHLTISAPRDNMRVHKESCFRHSWHPRAARLISHRKGSFKFTH